MEKEILTSRDVSPGLNIVTWAIGQHRIQRRAWCGDNAGNDR